MAHRPPPIKPNPRLSVNIKGRGPESKRVFWIVFLVGLLIVLVAITVILGGAIWVAVQ